MRKSNPRALRSWALVAASSALVVAAPSRAGDGAESRTLPPVALEAEAAGDDWDDEDLEALIVTVRRRQEFLGDVPVSATVLLGQELDERGLQSIEEVAAFVPNLTAFSGTSRQGTFISRGVGQRDALVSLDPGVGLYVDDGYVARGHGALVSTLDVERVEVLRGPQGTLYGKNTIGGAVKIITRKPGPDYEAYGELGGGNFSSVQGRAVLNIPIVANLLYTRFAVTGRDSEGYLENRDLFSSQNLAGDRYADDNIVALRGQVRVLPLDGMTIDLSGHWSMEEETTKGGQCVVGNRALASAIVLGPNPGDPSLNDICQAADDLDDLDFDTNLDDDFKLESYGVAATATHEFGRLLGLDEVTAKSITTWREQKVDEGFVDLDGTSFELAPGLGLLSLRAMDDRTQWQASQELQLQLMAFDEMLTTTVGFYGFWEETDGGMQQGNVFGQRILEETVTVDNQSYAGYSQSSLRPLEWLELVAGLRFTREKKSARAVINQLAPFPSPSDATDSRTYNKWTPQAGVNFHLLDEWVEPLMLDNALVYYTFSEGFKSGGFATRRDPSIANGLVSFDQEEVTTHEVGVKLSALQRKLTLSGAFYHSKYRDVQQTVVRVLVDPMGNFTAPNQPDLGSSIANAGEARIQGFELEAGYRPIEGLMLRASVGLTDADYKEFRDLAFTFNGSGFVDSADPTGTDRSDEPFFNVPKWNANASLQYTADLADWGLRKGGQLTTLFDVFYQGATHQHFTPAGFQSREFRQSSLVLLNWRMDYELFDERTEIGVFVNNILDERYFLSAVDLTQTIGTGTRFYARPLTVGAQLSYHWDAK